MSLEKATGRIGKNRRKVWLKSLNSWRKNSARAVYLVKSGNSLPALVSRARDLIRGKIFDLRLQGFSWLGKYFLECRQIFGAKTAVANFDIFGNTLLTISCAGQEFPKKLFHRTLDDVPFVAPAHKNWCETFTNCYKNVCDSVGVSLAPDCPKFEKAFSNTVVKKEKFWEFFSTQQT